MSDTEEVKEFVRAAGKCDFDIDVCYNRAVIDAKSLLGMLYLGLSKDLTVNTADRTPGLRIRYRNMQSASQTDGDRAAAGEKPLRAAALFLCTIHCIIRNRKVGSAAVWMHNRKKTKRKS